MERLKASGVLAAALAANRDRANGLVRLALHANPRFDTASFAAFVCGPLERLARDCASAAPSRAEALALDLYEVAVELFAHDLLGPGAHLASVGPAWDVVARTGARLVAEDPRGVLASMANLLVNMERESPGSGERWVQAAAPVAAACDRVQTFLDAGLVVAWRCGLPQYRASALECWRRLPDIVKPIALGIAEPEVSSSSGAIEAALADPWWAPGRPAAPRELRIAWRVGGFTGFGGPFARPPRVARAGGALVAFDRGGGWTVYADAFGATLVRSAGEVPEVSNGTNPAFTIDRNGLVRCGVRTQAFPELADAVGFAATEWTLAVTLKHSHLVHLVALTGS